MRIPVTRDSDVTALNVDVLRGDDADVGACLGVNRLHGLPDEVAAVREEAVDGEGGLDAAAATDGEHGRCCPGSSAPAPSCTRSVQPRR